MNPENLYRRHETGPWYIRFEYRGKDRRYSTGTTDRKEAQRELHRALADPEGYIRSRRGRISYQAPSVEAWAVEYIEAMKRAGKRDNREYFLRAFVRRFGSLRLDEITRLDIEAWKEWLVHSAPRSRGPASVHRFVAVARHFYSYACKLGYAHDNPLKGVDLPKLPPERVRYLQLEEADRLVRSAEPWLSPVLRLGFETGMRRGELCNIQRQDIDLTTRFIFLRHSKTGGGEQVPLTPRAVDAVRSVPVYLHHPYLFADAKGEPLVSHWRERNCEPGLPARAILIRNALIRACELAGIEDFRFHDMRHHTGSWLAMSGVHPDVRKAILRHRSDASARRYVHLDPAHLHEELKKFSERTAQPPAQRKKREL